MSSGWSVSPLIVWLLGAAVLSIGLAMIALLGLRRDRRHLTELMARLDAVEGSEGPAVAPPTEVGARPSAKPSGDSGPAPAADVLAGRTSYVAAMVAGVGAEAVSLADQTILCIYEHLDRSLRPGQLAEELFVSLRTLERVLSTTLDCSPRQLIVTIKMREARRLLQSGALRVNEVATRLGFGSAAHFSARFKAFYRAPPSHFVPEHPTQVGDRAGEPPA